MMSSTNTNNNDEAATITTCAPPQQQQQPQQPQPQPPRVAVLGCGPGGMFFCHAIALKRRVLLEQLKKNGSGGEDATKVVKQGPTLTDHEKAHPALALSKLPIVTVFEKGTGPGGVWRAQRSFAGNENNNTDEKKKKKNEKNTLSSSSSSSSPDSSSSPSKDHPTTTADPAAATNTNTSNNTVVVDASHSAEMYEALWCNGPKEAIEFFDYTYSDHYGHDTPLPSYLSRAEMLQIMLRRVTRQNSDFWKDYNVQFNTLVTNVTYDPLREKFSVTTKDVATEQTTHHYKHAFDKFIWAAGSYGRPNIPPSLSRTFAPFSQAGGRVIHSSNASQLQKDVGGGRNNGNTGKHVLLIGGSYSAEDLCLMACKLGARHVTISVRCADASVPVLWQNEWPCNKVTILENQVPFRVSRIDRSDGSDGDGSPRCTVDFVKYVPDQEEDEEESDSESDTEKKDDDAKLVEDKPIISTTLADVDTVIFCTGYTGNWDMLDRSVYNMPNDDDFERYWEQTDVLDLPDDWKMPHNAMTDELIKHNVLADNENSSDDGHVTPSTDIGPGYYAYPYSYNEVNSVENPNFFYFNGGAYDAPLLALDAQAYVMLAIITGAHKRPDSIEEIKRRNYQEALYEMTLPGIRFQMDVNYRRAIRKLPKYPWPKHWDATFKEWSRWQFCRLGQLMRVGRYPFQVVVEDNGGDSALHVPGSMILNDKGNALLDMDYNCRNYNTNASDNTTFRDIKPKHCRYLASIHTGAVPVPFGKLWMELDDLAEAPKTV